jgi:hypothetical protein
MPEFGGRGVVVIGRIVVLDRDGVLAQLLPAHDVVVGIAVVHPDDPLRQRHC